MEEHIEGSDNAQQVIFHMVSKISEDLNATLGVVKVEAADLSARLNLTIMAIGNKIPVEV